MSVTFERILAWKLLPRAVMATMLFMYVEVLYWFMAIPRRSAHRPRRSQQPSLVRSAALSDFGLATKSELDGGAGHSTWPFEFQVTR